jgi:hypothetical protein
VLREINRRIDIYSFGICVLYLLSTFYFKGLYKIKDIPPDLATNLNLILDGLFNIVDKCCIIKFNADGSLVDLDIELIILDYINLITLIRNLIGLPLNPDLIPITGKQKGLHPRFRREHLRNGGGVLLFDLNRRLLFGANGIVSHIDTVVYNAATGPGGPGGPAAPGPAAPVAEDIAAGVEDDVEVDKDASNVAMSLSSFVMEVDAVASAPHSDTSRIIRMSAEPDPDIRVIEDLEQLPVPKLDTIVRPEIVPPEILELRRRKAEQNRQRDERARRRGERFGLTDEDR